MFGPNGGQAGNQGYLRMLLSPGNMAVKLLIVLILKVAQMCSYRRSDSNEGAHIVLSIFCLKCSSKPGALFPGGGVYALFCSWI